MSPVWSVYSSGFLDADRAGNRKNAYVQGRRVNRIETLYESPLVDVGGSYSYIFVYIVDFSKQFDNVSY